MSEQETSFLQNLLQEVVHPNGSAKVENFASLRDVDSKTKELKFFLKSKGGHSQILTEIENDPDFGVASRRVRLEATGNYIRTILKFSKIGTQEKKQPSICPDLSKLTASNPSLEVSIANRWKEAQICQFNGCYLAAIIMMGSILEALLLAKAINAQTVALQSSKAPKDKNGKQIPIQDWNLHQLIEVSVDVGWLKVDRGRFSHALRQSRNAIHPWEEVLSKINYDEGTCQTSWEVLKASVGDLLR